MNQEAKAAVRELVGIRTTRFADGGADHEAWEVAQERAKTLTGSLTAQQQGVATRAASMLAGRRIRAARQALTA